MSGCATIESPFASIQSPEVDSVHSLCMKSESNMGGYDGLDDESDSIFGKGSSSIAKLVRNYC